VRNVLVIENYEVTHTKLGNVVFSFDTIDFRPAGDLIVATVEGGSLTLVWTDSATVVLPDANPKLAGWLVAAPVVSVRWLAGGLLRGSDLRMA
jgi:hypothetical protein